MTDPHAVEHAALCQAPHGSLADGEQCGHLSRIEQCWEFCLRVGRYWRPGVHAGP